MGSSFAKVLREMGLGGWSKARTPLPWGRQAQPVTLQPLLFSLPKFHLAAQTPGCGMAESQGGASERGGAPSGGGQPALGAGEEGTAGNLGGHNMCVLSHASQVMDTKVLLGWSWTYSSCPLTSSLFPGHCHRLYWREGCSPMAVF